MSIKLELFKVFKEVCDYGSLSEAAKALFISQSAVSQSIKQLETQVGTPLLRRNSKGITKTAEGELLYEYASSAIGLLQVAQEKIEMMKSLQYGDLRIGASDTIAHYILLPKLEIFNKLYPKIKLQIINRTSTEAISLIKSGKIDLAFINMPIEDEDISVIPYCEVQDIFVASKNSPFVNKQYTLQQISKTPLIFLEKKSNSRCYVEAFLTKQGVKISPEIELGSHDLLLEFARINLGVSCVIEQFSRHYLDCGDLIKLNINPMIPKRSIGVATLKGVSLSNASTKFLEICRG